LQAGINIGTGSKNTYLLPVFILSKSKLMTANPELQSEVVTTVALVLGETESAPIEQIGRIVERLGPMRVIDLVQQARAIQKDGGMPTVAGDRQRTLGGIFFRIAHRYLNNDGRHYVWPERAARRKARRQEVEVSLAQQNPC
jgi:hypothetical protein